MNYILSFLFGMAFMIFIIEVGGGTLKKRYEAIDLAIEQCEKELPRHQKCTYRIIAEVADERAN